MCQLVREPTHACVCVCVCVRVCVFSTGGMLYDPSCTLIIIIINNTLHNSHITTSTICLFLSIVYSLDAQCTRDMGDTQESDDHNLQEEKEGNSQEDKEKVLRDAVRSFSEKSAATAAWHKTQVINGVKSTVGLTIFTGGHRKLFHHPESQISLSPVFDREKRLDYGQGQCLDGKGRRNYIGGERLHISIS